MSPPDMRHLVHVAATALAATILSGCVKLDGKAPASLLTLTSAARVAGGDARSAVPADAISISVPMVPQALANTRVAVNSGDVSVAYVKDAVWVEPPAKLFHRVLSETVSAKTGKVVIDPRQFVIDPGTQLTGQLRQFGVDVDAGRHEAVIIYDAALRRAKSSKVDTRRFEARVPVSVVETLAVGNALNQAANRIAGEVADWIAAG
jgi:cholesterol transport system auxiliary component